MYTHKEEQMLRGQLAVIFQAHPISIGARRLASKERYARNLYSFCPLSLMASLMLAFPQAMILHVNLLNWGNWYTSIAEASEFYLEFLAEIAHSSQATGGLLLQYEVVGRPDSHKYPHSDPYNLLVYFISANGTSQM